MWSPDASKLVRVRLTNQGEDVEMTWGEDLGSVPGDPEARRVRLGNIPFLHAKPTYGDVLDVRPSEEDGVMEWDQEGVAFEEIGERIAHDDRRWVMIIDWLAAPAIGADETFRRLDVAAETVDIAVEGASLQDDGGGGRAYLAVPDSMGVPEVVAWLRSARVKLDFTLIHPEEGG